MSGKESKDWPEQLLAICITALSVIMLFVQVQLPGWGDKRLPDKEGANRSKIL